MDSNQLKIGFNKLLTMTTESEFLSSYERIKTSYRSAMTQIDNAISHEEDERPCEAIAAYERCVQQIEETFAIPVGLPDNIDTVEPEWNDACTIIQKLKGARTEVSYRLKVLRTQVAPVDTEAVEAAELRGEEGGGAAAAAEETAEPAAKKKSLLLDNPPTYYDISSASSDTPRTYREIIAGLRDVIATKNSGVLFDTLFQSQAKLYKIEPNGVVATVSGETSMSLVMCTVSGKWQFLNGVFFIQCALPASQITPPSASSPSNEPTATAAAAASSTDNNEESSSNMIWIYPLVPRVTTCYRTEYGAFILPDLESDGPPGTAFGIMLSDPSAPTTPAEEEAVGELSDLQQFFLDLLEAVLAGTVEQLQQPLRPRDTSQQVSKHIVTAADFIARNLVKGAEKTGELMVKSTPYIISKMNAAPADAPPVSSKVQTSVEVAKNVTSVAVGVTGWMADKVGSASLALGRFLSPHIQKHGATLLEKGCGYDSAQANSKMEGAFTIAAGAVEGFTTVYTGLETSAKILGTNLSDNSVKIIGHKYGPSAENVAAGTFDTIGNAFNVSQNVNYFTPKGFAKKMAKNTGKAVVDDYKRNLREESQFVAAGSLYPDLRSLKEKQG